MAICCSSSVYQATASNTFCVFQIFKLGTKAAFCCKHRAKEAFGLELGAKKAFGLELGAKKAFGLELGAKVPLTGSPSYDQGANPGPQTAPQTAPHFRGKIYVTKHILSNKCHILFQSVPYFVCFTVGPWSVLWPNSPSVSYLSVDVKHLSLYRVAALGHLLFVP
jgi:hypothetical protein